MDELKKCLTYVREELEAIYTGANNEENESNEEATDFYEYVSDSLDIEYRIDSKGEYRGAYIWVTLGGPNIHIDTFSGYIKGAWGSDREELWLPREIAEELDRVCEEIFEYLK